MFHSLYFKLVVVLFTLFILIGAVFLAVAMYTAPMYQQEVSQRLNRDLATYIVNEHVLVEDGRVRRDNLGELFRNVMTINPSLELYLLDPDGQVVAHSMPRDRVKRRWISLAPIRTFLADGGERGLIMGDDPSFEDRQTGFTVAPIDFGNERQGYIYAILGSEKITHVTDLLQRSLIMKWSLGAVVIALVFAFVAGLVMFFFLMRKLRLLSTAMQQFKAANLVPEDTAADCDTESLDEIEAMAATFEAMARRIQQQVDGLREAESLRRELVANVSHDLRTPLASLSGFLETLQLKADTLGADEKQAYLRIACDNAARLRSLVEELFELAKLDANEVQPQREQFSLAELAFDLSHQFHLRAREKQIDFRVVADETVPFVVADVGMIERVLENLIDNSFKHTPDHGRIELQLSARSGQVEIAVSDTGEGIARDELPHVTRRFYRKPAPVDGVDDGLGLGLAIASRIVELHGSELVVDSALSEGTVFRFTLPASPGQEGPRPRADS